MLTAADVKVSPVCIADATVFTLVCFWIELQQFLFRQKYHSLESSYEFCSLACSILSKSSGCVFPILVALVSIIKEKWAKLNRSTYIISVKKA
jgi:hypothetical protein